jgi:hypothetical protein
VVTSQLRKREHCQTLPQPLKWIDHESSAFFTIQNNHRIAFTDDLDHHPEFKQLADHEIYESLDHSIGDSSGKET